MAEIRGLEPLFAGRQPAVIAFIPYLLKLFSRRRAPLPEDLDPRRIADRRLSKVGGDAPGAQASPMREHIDELLVRTEMEVRMGFEPIFLGLQASVWPLY